MQKLVAPLVSVGLAALAWVGPAGLDTRFAWRSDAGDDRGERACALVLTTDAGAFPCVLRLTLEGWGPRGRGAEAEARDVRGGASPLAVELVPLGDGRARVVVCDGAAGAEPFRWPAGGEVVVRVAGLDDVAVEDWEVLHPDEPKDSRGKRRLRLGGKGLAIVLLGVAFVLLLAPAGRARARGERGKVSLELLARLVDQVDGRTRRETRMMRRALRKAVLQESGTQEVLDVIPLPRASRAQLWFQARQRFLDRLAQEVGALERVRTRLETPAHPARRG